MLVLERVPKWTETTEMVLSMVIPNRTSTARLEQFQRTLESQLVPGIFLGNAKCIFISLVFLNFSKLLLINRTKEILQDTSLCFAVHYVANREQ